MPLKCRKQPHEEAPQIVCVSPEGINDAGPPCDGTEFTVWNDPDRGGPTLHCETCGEEYELTYMLDILSGKQ